jgi:hypothetical protein
MNKIKIATIATVLTLLTASAGIASEPWLHVHVSGADAEEQVRVNVPLKLVSTLLQSVHTDELQNGKIRIDEQDFDDIDLRAMLEAVRDAEDAEFIRVRDPESDVRVAKEGDRLLVRVEPRGEGEDRVRVQVPMALVEALLLDVESGGELNVAAAIEMLGTLQGEDLVMVESDDETVRIWIDDLASNED